MKGLKTWDSTVPLIERLQLFLVQFSIECLNTKTNPIPYQLDHSTNLKL